MLLFAFITLIGWLLGGTVGIGTVISMFGAGGGDASFLQHHSL